MVLERSATTVKLCSTINTVRLADTGVLYVRAETPAWLAAVRKSTSLIQIRLDDLLGENTVKKLDFS